MSTATTGFRPSQLLRLANGDSPTRIESGEEAIDRLAEDGGFSSLHEFAFAVAKTADRQQALHYPYLLEKMDRWRGAERTLRKIHEANQRYITKSTPSGGGEDIGDLGGNAIPAGFVREVWNRVYSNNDILNRCRRITIDRPQTAYPANGETARTSGNRCGGITSTYLTENTQIPSSKPTVRLMDVRAKKLAILVYATDELVEDSALFGDWLMTAVENEFAYRQVEGIISATGAGVPMGYVHAPATIVVSKTTGQAAGTIQNENVNSMWSRFWGPSRKNAVWLCHSDALEQIDSMALPVGNSIYTPAGAAGNSEPLLKGRPMLEAEAAPALGSVGDIALVDLSQVGIFTLSTTPGVQVSIHLRFDTHERAFKFLLRWDAMPLWAAPVSPGTGTNTRSAFVTLAARA